MLQRKASKFGSGLGKTTGIFINNNYLTNLKFNYRLDTSNNYSNERC